jgi:hypothetical protein
MARHGDCDFILSRSIAAVWPDEAGGWVVVVIGCRRDLVGTAGAKANGDGEANHGY